jgi:large-conductance mechanosensitive channel
MIKEKIKKTHQEVKKYQLALVKQMLTLATSAFGLVAALAWNELIKTLIDDYIKPAIGSSSVLVSLIIYALIVTVLAVFVTLQLSKLAEKLEEEK